MHVLIPFFVASPLHRLHMATRLLWGIPLISLLPQLLQLLLFALSVKTCNFCENRLLGREMGEKMNSADLTLILPGGGKVKTYSTFVTFGSSVLRAAYELLKEGEANSAAVVHREIEIPIHVCFWGFSRAVDELLPDYLRTTAKIGKFNPFKKAHRDYLSSCLLYTSPSPRDS